MTFATPALVRTRSIQLLLAVAPVLGNFTAQGQASGFNLLLDYRKPDVSDGEGSSMNAAFGLSFQHDFRDRLGMGITFLYNPDDATGMELQYDSKYFTSSNDVTAFYVGSFLGVQRIDGSVYTGRSYDDVSRIHVPIGLQLGVRGGLAGYFAELRFKLGYRIGHGPLGEGPYADLASEPLYLGLSFSYLGIGWEH